MSLLPDPAEMRAIADRISAHATAVRTRAAHLDAAVAGAAWHGPAARAFDASALGVIHGLRSAAGRLDDAADALRRHARRVEHALAALSRAAHAAGHVLGDAGDILTDVATDPTDLPGDITNLASDVGDALSSVGDLIGIG
jgi:uncharacterized protein YukE